MEVHVGTYKNVTQEEIRAAASGPFISWNACIMQIGTKRSVGAVDAMMKKDVRAIVRAYAFLVMKRGYREFPPGKYEIQIRDGGGWTKPLITVPVEVK